MYSHLPSGYLHWGAVLAALASASAGPAARPGAGARRPIEAEPFREAAYGCTEADYQRLPAET